MLGSLVIPYYLHGVHLQELQAVQSQGRASTASLRSIFSATLARISASGATRISDSFMRFASLFSTRLRSDAGRLEQLVGKEFPSLNLLGKIAFRVSQF